MCCLTGQYHSAKKRLVQLAVLSGESTFLSRVEGSMSRARVPCRGSRITFFFSSFFLEKVIIDAINVIETNKKNLKNKWHVNIS